MSLLYFQNSIFKLAAYLIILFNSHNLLGQMSPEVLYQSAISSQSHLSNGSSFKPSYASRTEHPFFLDPQFTKASITYDRVLYKDVKLLYNLATEELLLKDSISGKIIRLIGENISSFSIHNHSFLKFNSNPDLEDGFYDLLHDGTCRVLIRRDKSLQYIKRDGRIKNIYQARDRIFLIVNGQVFPVTTKSSILEGFGTNAIGVKNGIKNVEVKFSSDKENYCVAAAKIFDQLMSRWGYVFYL